MRAAPLEQPFLEQLEIASHLGEHRRVVPHRPVHELAQDARRMRNGDGLLREVPERAHARLGFADQAEAVAPEHEQDARLRETAPLGSG